MQGYNTAEKFWSVPARVINFEEHSLILLYVQRENTAFYFELDPIATGQSNAEQLPEQTV